MKRGWIVGLMAAATLAAGAAPAAAEPTVKEYADAETGAKAVYKLYITAQETAFGWSNAMLENRKQAPLYCQPSNVTMSSDDTIALYEGFVAKHPGDEFGKYPLGLVLLTALQEKFPCPK